MKRGFVLLAVFLSSLISLAQDQANDAFYIYRNDGEFNAFFRNEVQSIEYSNYDADGNYHNEIVTQIVNTTDSVYKIPLAAIDSVAFDVNKITVSPDFVALTGDDYVIEKADTLNGKYILSFVGNIPSLLEGDIISIVNDTLAQLVRIAEIIRLDETRLDIRSHHVTLGEVFTGGSFTLSTENEPSEAPNDSPSSRTFYPVEISFFDDENKFHRIRRSNTEFARRLYTMPIDFSGKDLHKTAHTRLYAEKCKFDLALDLVISCNFSSKKEASSLYKKGELELIKSVVRGTVDTDFMIRFDASGSDEKQYEAQLLKANIHKPVVATFVVAGVPIAIVMNTNLYGELSYNVSGGFSAYTGHTTSTTAELGFSWAQNRGVKPYVNFDTSFDFHKPTIEGNAHLESKLSIFPRITFSLYGIIGPTFDLKPYLHPVVELGFHDQMGSNKEDFYGAEYDLYGGYDAAVGISEFSVLGREPIVMSPSWNVIDKMLVEAPKKIDFVSSVPDALVLGRTMRVTFQAFDYSDILNDYIHAGLPLPVKFVTNSGTLSSDFALTDPETGLVSIDWTPDAWKVDGEDAYILALMYTPEGHVKAADRWTPTIIEVNPESFVEVVAESITSTSAQIEYGFSHVPKDAVCNVAIQAEDEENPTILPVQCVEKDTILVSDLSPNTTYTCWAFVEYMGKTYMDLDGKQTFTTLEPTAYVEKVDEEKITTTSAEVVYGFSNVPENAKCYIGISANIRVTDDETGEEILKQLSQQYSVSDTVRGVYMFTDLYPGTTYTYYSYIEYEGDTWFSDGEQFTTKTPPLPVATTGDCSVVTTNSANVTCTYDNVPEGGICGVEYTWAEGSYKQSTSSSNGTQTIALSGLKSGTAYTYCAYIEANGRTYYGEEKTFTTKYEIPDISGTWNCTKYNEDGSVLETSTLTLNTNGTVTAKSISGTDFVHDHEGKWGINANGEVNISFSWSSGNNAVAYYNERFSGKLDNLSTPTSISGSVKRESGTSMVYWSGNYTFIMTR